MGGLFKGGIRGGTFSKKEIFPPYFCNFLTIPLFVKRGWGRLKLLPL